MIRAYALAASALVLGTAAHAGGASTTRVVPEEVYGATVSVEEGVRVFRPLPSDRLVIVNPHGQTDIDVEVKELTVTAPGTVRR